MTEPERLSDTDINAYVDGELDAQGLAEVETWLADHPQDAARVHAYKLQRIQFHLLYDLPKDTPLPDGVREALASSGVRRWLPGWRQMAAAFLLISLGGAGGWWGDVVVEKAQRTAGSAFVHRALSAHAVYAYDMARPVEIGVNEETDLLNWLSERLGQTLKTPDLASAGFTLIGGRLVADQNEPAALFMYEDDQNRRVTLYVRRGMGGLDTKFRFIAEDERSSLYWTDRALDYALTGDMPRSDLLKLAQMISQEIEAKATT